MDVDTIELGVDFAEEITRAVAACQVLVAVIGPGWLTATDERGRRRLDDPDDFVRLEIEAALARGVRVIPILAQGAVMPGRDDLPESLASLARRNALFIRHESFRSDAGRLVAAIERVLAAALGTPAVLSAPDTHGAQSAGNAPGGAAQQDIKSLPEGPSPSHSCPSRCTTHRPVGPPRKLAGQGARRGRGGDGSHRPGPRRPAHHRSGTLRPVDQRARTRGPARWPMSRGRWQPPARIARNASPNRSPNMRRNGCSPLPRGR